MLKKVRWVSSVFIWIIQNGDPITLLSSKRRLQVVVGISLLHVTMKRNLIYLEIYNALLPPHMQRHPILTCLARKYDNLVTQIILHQKVLLISLGTLQMLLLWNWEHIPVLILGPLIITLSLSRSLSFSSTLSIPKHYYLLLYLYYLPLTFLLPLPS